MADIASGDVTYTVQSEKRGPSSRYNATFRLAFGDGALTYPALGIPLARGNLGCPTIIESLKIYDEANGNGYSYKFDATNNKIRIWQAPAQSHNHTLFLNDAEVADGATTRVNAGTNLLGAGTGSDVSIAGVANTAGHGGIVTATLAAAAGTELGNVAVAATVIYVEVLGW